MEAFVPEAKFDHVAHGVPRIRDVLPIYAGLLGGKFLFGGSEPRYGYRAVQLGFADGSKIELLEATPGSAFLDSFLTRNPLGGLHHVTFRVPDIRDAVERARQGGFQLFGEHFDNPDWREAFLHPRGAAGVLIQMVQAPEDFPRPEPRVTLESILGDNSDI